MEQALVGAHGDKYVRTVKIGVLILSLLTLCPFLFSYTGTVQAADAISHTSQAAASCSGPSQLNSKSQLVVLLDRSGSLVAGPTTDPEGYSGSVTNALADLWPGNIAVIPFGNNQANKLGKGVFAHSSTSDLTTLKSLVDGTFPPPSDADTPLGLAMDHAKTLFEQQGVTPCSQVVLITDGQPTGPGGRIDDVRNQFIPWFKSQGIPVNAFGLKLDTNTQDGHNADSLLREIANTTNGKYTPVVNATDLASSVIGLYSAWKGLSFTRVAENTQNGNYPITVDGRVTQTTIITFHSTGVSVGQLERSDGNVIPPDKLFHATDRHYQIDNLVSPIIPGIYTITVGSDPNASVYALVDSPLKAEFTGMANTAYTGQSITIKAHFIDEHGGVIIKGATKVTATLTEVIDGKPTIVTIDLHQLAPDSDIFVGDYPVPSTDTKLTDQPQLIGNLTLDLTATYNDVTRSATTTIPLYAPQKPPCNQGFWNCNRTAIVTSITIATPFLLLLIIALILWLIWRQQPAPFGTLRTPPSPRKRRHNDDDDDEVTLSLSKVEAVHPLRQRIFHRSIITSGEIQMHRDAKGAFDFDLASFDLVFKKGRVVELRSTSMESILIKHENNSSEKLDQGETVLLNNGDTIIIANKDRAIFSSL